VDDYPTEVFWFFRAFPEATGFAKVWEAIENGATSDRVEGLAEVEISDLGKARFDKVSSDPLADRCLEFLEQRELDTASFLKLVSRPGQWLAARNLEPWRGLAVVGAYCVDTHLLWRSGWTSFPPDEQDQLNKNLRDRGVLVGEYDGGTGLLWTDSDGDGFMVWKKGETLLLRGDSALLHYRHGRTIGREEIATVEAYVADDFVERGVRVLLRDGTAIDVLFEMNTTAESMLGYNRNDLLFDSSWAVHVGAILAGWAGADFRDLI